MRAALHLGDDRLHFLFREIDNRDPRARRAKGQRNLAPDAAGAARDQDALASSPDARFQVIAVSPRWRLDARGFFDIAGMRVADEFGAILDQHGAKRVGREGAVGVRDAVEPSLAHAIPSRFFRSAAIDAAEAQPAQAGKLAHDLRMAPGPMREEFLAAEAGLATDETDSPDHDR